jgi:hypothetical protein
MRFFSPPSLFVLLPALALSTSILDLPAAQDVKQSVINIHNAVLELDATVQAFTGGSFETAYVEGKEVLAGLERIHIVNREGLRRALAALPFNVEDTVDVINTVVFTGMYRRPRLGQFYATRRHLVQCKVNVSIPLSTQHLREKGPVFKANGLSSRRMDCRLSCLLVSRCWSTITILLVLRRQRTLISRRMRRGWERVSRPRPTSMRLLPIRSCLYSERGRIGLYK